MKTLFITQKFEKNYSSYYEYVEYNHRKFRIRIEISNGDPCGFNTKQCLSVMTSDGVFEHVADCNMIGETCRNDYYSTPNEKASYTLNLARAFREFIKKIYG